MPLGYCMECRQLKAIRPAGQQWGSRQVNWRPVDHTTRRHRGCEGLVLPLEAGLICQKCDSIVDENRTYVERCEGTDKDIR